MVPGRRASATGGDIGWKQLRRHAPILGQTFCGHSGHGITGLWHGICWAAAAADGIGAAIASAIGVVIGTAASAASMAIMPSAANNRWVVRFLTTGGCHTFRPLAILQRQ
jgi:hypothetical protein